MVYSGNDRRCPLVGEILLMHASGNDAPLHAGKKRDSYGSGLSRKFSEDTDRIRKKRQALSCYLCVHPGEGNGYTVRITPVPVA